jgi:hypothetical protein
MIQAGVCFKCFCFHPSLVSISEVIDTAPSRPFVKSSTVLAALFVEIVVSVPMWSPSVKS